MNSWEKPREDRLLKNSEKPTYSSPSISSFSSTILEGIYRSMDEENENCGKLKYFKEKISKTEKNEGDDKRVVKTKARISIENEEMASLRRARLVEKWMEKKVNNKVSSAARQRPRLHHGSRDPLLSTSDSRSSNNTTTSGTFSSSDARFSRPKPVRTSVSPEAQLEKVKAEDEVWQIKSKLRTLKIYSNLKKIKQPISPGGARLVSFLNSLFTAKKKKNTSSEANDDDGRVGVKTQASNSSTCSTTTSYYRSCLNKTSSKEKCNDDGVKRTVRFYPVTVIVDEDRRPCNHKCIYQDYPKNMVTNNDDQSSVLAEKKSLKIADILKGYAKDEKQNNSGGDDNEDENDTTSDLSSDLFELDHLAFIGNKNNSINDSIRYCEELPVYETTEVRA